VTLPHFKEIYILLGRADEGVSYNLTGYDRGQPLSFSLGSGQVIKGYVSSHPKPRLSELTPVQMG
jgi:hypothetical protein